MAYRGRIESKASEKRERAKSIYIRHVLRWLLYRFTNTVTLRWKWWRFLPRYPHVFTSMGVYVQFIRRCMASGGIAVQGNAYFEDRASHEFLQPSFTLLYTCVCYICTISSDLARSESTRMPLAISIRFSLRDLVLQFFIQASSSSKPFMTKSDKPSFVDEFNFHASSVTLSKSLFQLLVYFECFRSTFGPQWHLGISCSIYWGGRKNWRNSVKFIFSFLHSIDGKISRHMDLSLIPVIISRTLHLVD